MQMFQLENAELGVSISLASTQSKERTGLGLDRRWARLKNAGAGKSLGAAILEPVWMKLGHWPTNNLV